LKLKPGESALLPNTGPLSVRVDRHHDGVTITTIAGADRISGLSTHFLNHDLAAGGAWLRALLDLARTKDATVRSITDAMDALTQAAHAITPATTEGATR